MRTKRIMLYAVIATLGTYLGLPGLATAAKDTQVGVADQAFAMMAAEGGLAEVQLAKLAQDRASNPGVKQLAQRLVQDHTKANQELMTLGKNKDMSLPDEVDDIHEDLAKLFSRLEGAQFDREFLWYQLMHHEKDVTSFGLQAKEGQDADLKAFAAKQLPVLQEHLKQVRELVSQHASGKGGTTTERSTTSR